MLFSTFCGTLRLPLIDTILYGLYLTHMLQFFAVDALVSWLVTIGSCKPADISTCLEPRSGSGSGTSGTILLKRDGQNITNN